MLPISWSETALEELDIVIGYIAERNPRAAEKLLYRIENSVLPASEHPYIFPAGRVSGTREIVAHPNYIVVYRIRADCIEVLNVLHARQEYP